MDPEVFALPRAQLIDYFGEDKVSEKHLPDGRHVFRIARSPPSYGVQPLFDPRSPRLHRSTRSARDSGKAGNPPCRGKGAS